MWPFGPVSTVPTEPAVPELTVSVPEPAAVVPDAPGETVEEVVVAEPDDPELQAAAVTARPASSAKSVQRLGPRGPRPRADPRGNPASPT